MPRHLLEGCMYMRDYFKAVNCICYKLRFCISLMLEIAKPVKELSAALCLK